MTPTSTTTSRHSDRFRRALTAALFCALALLGHATKVLIPMDKAQTDHLKAYGIAYWVLQQNVTVEWLLNYRGGSFLIDDDATIERECRIRGVSYEVIADAQAQDILAQIADPEVNMEMVLLEKAPKIAVYAPPAFQPWDDAVTLALTYAEIPYTRVWDEEVLAATLPQYDWLHLHHEDFTGQYGKFYGHYRNAPWYQVQSEGLRGRWPRKLGFSKVSQMKRAVAVKIRDFVAGGGFLFAMCSGTDTFDIALAAEGVDIVARRFDGDPPDPDCQAQARFSQTLRLPELPPRAPTRMVYEFSDIDMTDMPSACAARPTTSSPCSTSAPSRIRCRPCSPRTTCNVIKGFMGQTTGFRKEPAEAERHRSWARSRARTR